MAVIKTLTDVLDDIEVQAACQHWNYKLLSDYRYRCLDCGAETRCYVEAGGVIHYPNCQHEEEKGQ